MWHLLWYPETHMPASHYLWSLFFTPFMKTKALLSLLFISTFWSCGLNSSRNTKYTVHCSLQIAIFTLWFLDTGGEGIVLFRVVCVVSFCLIDPWFTNSEEFTDIRWKSAILTGFEFCNLAGFHRLPPQFYKIWSNNVDSLGSRVFPNLNWPDCSYAATSVGLIFREQTLKYMADSHPMMVQRHQALGLFSVLEAGKSAH